MRKVRVILDNGKSAVFMIADGTSFKDAKIQIKAKIPKGLKMKSMEQLKNEVEGERRELSPQLQGMPSDEQKALDIAEMEREEEFLDKEQEFVDDARAKEWAGSDLYSRPLTTEEKTEAYKDDDGYIAPVDISGVVADSDPTKAGSFIFPQADMLNYVKDGKQTTGESIGAYAGDVASMPGRYIMSLVDKVLSPKKTWDGESNGARSMADIPEAPTVDRGTPGRIAADMVTDEWNLPAMAAGVGAAKLGANLVKGTKLAQVATKAPKWVKPGKLATGAVEGVGDEATRQTLDGKFDPSMLIASGLFGGAGEYASDAMGKWARNKFDDNMYKLNFTKKDAKVTEPIQDLVYNELNKNLLPISLDYPKQRTINNLTETIDEAGPKMGDLIERVTLKQELPLSAPLDIPDTFNDDTVLKFADEIAGKLGDNIKKVDDEKLDISNLIDQGKSKLLRDARIDRNTYKLTDSTLDETTGYIDEAINNYLKKRAVIDPDTGKKLSGVEQLALLDFMPTENQAYITSPMSLHNTRKSIDADLSNYYKKAGKDIENPVKDKVYAGVRNEIINEALLKALKNEPSVHYDVDNLGTRAIDLNNLLAKTYKTRDAVKDLKSFNSYGTDIFGKVYDTAVPKSGVRQQQTANLMESPLFRTLVRTLGRNAYNEQSNSSQK